MRNIYVKDDKYTLSWICDEDKEFYTELHRETYGEDSLYINPRSADVMWEATIRGSEDIFSVFDNENHYCGSIEIQQPHTKTPELGINLFIEDRNKGICPRTVKLLTSKYIEDHAIDYFIIRISSDNSHSIHVFEKMGAVLMTEEANPFAILLNDMTENLNMDDNEINFLTKQFDQRVNLTSGTYKYRYMP